MRKLMLVAAIAMSLALLPAMKAAAADLIPQAKGLFGIDEGKLVQLLRPEVAVKDYEGKSVKGFPKNTNFKRFDMNVRFVMWDDFVNPHDGKAVRLVYEGIKIQDGQ